MKEDVRLDKKRPRLILSDSESDTLDDWKPDGLRILKCSEEVEIDRKKAGLGDVRSREDAYADKMRSRVDSFAIDRENLNVDSLKRRKENLKIKGKLVLHKKVEMECRRSCLGDGKKESDVQRKSGLVNDRDRVRVEKDKKFRSHMLTRENFGVTGRSREDAEADEMRSRSESFVIDIKRINVDSLKHREEKTKVEGKFDLHRKVDMERRRSCSSARKTESNLLRKCRLVNDGERVRKEKETKFRSFMLTKEKFGSTVTSREDAEADKMRRKKVNVEAERKSVNDGDRVRMPKDDKFCSFGLGLKRRADSFKLGQCIGINRKKIKTDSLEREDEKHEFKGKIITGSLSVEPSAIRRKGEGLTVDRHMEKDEKFQPGGLTTGLKHREDSFKSGQCIGINRKKIKTDSLEREGEKHEFKGKIISGSLPVDPSATRRKGEGLEVDRQMEKGEKFQSGGLTRDISRVPCHKGIRVLGKNGVLRLIPKKMYNQKEAKDNRNDSVSIGITEHKVITAKNHANQPELSSAEVEKIKAHEMKTKDFGILEEDVDECSSLSNKQKEKAQRNGRGNEMQLLRDRIKNMLLNAGWKIDFKPRRNKDYTDSIYVSPEGTGYWSIVKAYYALEKQLNCKNKGDNNHSLIPMEVLSILTRRRVKKVKEKKTKKRGDNDEIKLVKKNKRVKETMGSCNNTDEQNGVIGLKAKGIARKLKRGHLSENVGYSGNSGRRCTLLVRGSNKSANLDTDDYIPYAGKRTVLSWLIDSGTVPENVKVQYMNKKRTRGRLVGRITRAGIHCNCCSKIITVSKFEIHAGSKLSQPFQNILVETGLTLLQCLLDAWDKQDESERCGFHSVGADDDGDPNDDTCGICGDGGDLICCDGCPSTFHQSCLDIQILPPGEWHCPNCSCKFCGTVGGSTSQGDGVTASQLLSCFQCERRYHQGCIRETDAKPVYSNSLHRSFCGQSCRKLFKQLQKLLGLKNDLEAGFSWTLIRRFGGDRDISSHMLAQRADCNSKLAVALSIMDECFMPIIDQRSVINLIHNVLYNCGSNFNRLNYSGFYTVILERGDEIISAASIRIHGTRLAEMPFIGTRHIYRRQGMCRRLLNAIESALCSLNVEKLIIPAISELIHTWTEVFGFKPLEESHKQELRSMNMLVFPSTGLLQKVLLKRDFNEGNATSVLEDIELKSNHLETSEATNNLLMAAYVGSDLHPSDGGGGDTHEVKDEVSAVESAPPDTPHGSNFQASFEGTMCTNSGSPYKPPEPFDEGFCIHSDVAHHNKLKVENISPMASPIEPNLHLPGEVTLHNSHELNHGVTGLEPNVHASVRISVQDSSKAIIESLDAVAGSTFHASGGSIIQCKSEWLDKSQELASDASPMEPNVHTYCENTVHDAPGRKVEGASVEANIPSSGECTTSENHIVNEVNSEVAAVECKHPTLGEDSVPYVLKAVSKTLLVASEPNCQTFSDVAVVLPVDALHHNLHEHNMRGVSNGSIMASPRKFNIQGTLIDTDTHRIEVGSAEVIAESLNEPNIQSSGGSCVHHNSKMMYKFTKSILDASLHDSPVVNEFIITSVEPKFWSPDDGAVHDNHELKDEVAPVELNVHTSVESSLCYTS